MLLQSKA